MAQGIMADKSKKIGVLLGGLSSERSVSLRTGRAILGALKRRGYDAVEIDVGTGLVNDLREARIELAVIALHGPFGEDGCVQGVLELLGIPYTGSGVMASAVAMDKRVAKEILAFRGIPTPAWIEVRTNRLEGLTVALPFGFPVVVKPVAEGSTVGIEVVRDEADLPSALRRSAEFGSRLLIEQFIAGTEVTVGVINGRSLPALEIVPKSGIYDFHAKYSPGQTDFHLPARISPELEARCQALSLQVYEALECDGVARVDFRIDAEGTCFVLELNTVPGMTETSLIPKAAAHIGMSFEDVCEEMVAGASVKVHRRD